MILPNIISGGADARTVVLFHRDADGFASAFAAWCALGQDGVRYESVKYGEPMPAIAGPGPDGRGCRVFIVDFSYKRAELLELVRRGCELTVLDHHKTAAAELEGLAFCTFDMGKAGCELAWDYFSRPENVTALSPAAEVLAEPIPEVLRMIALRDLWRHVELPPAGQARVEAICARMELVPWEFVKWYDVVLGWNQLGNRTDFLREGEAVMAYKHQIARSQARQHFMLNLRGAASPVPACAGSVLQSETAHDLLTRFPLHDVVAVVSLVPLGYGVRLGGSGNVDVSEIAKRYEGGGGHRNAAGFFYAGELPSLTGFIPNRETQSDGTPWWQKFESSSATDRAVVEFVDEYETALGEDGQYEYTPSSFERWLIYDAICGIDADNAYCEAIAAEARQANRAAPAKRCRVVIQPSGEAWLHIDAPNGLKASINLGIRAADSIVNRALRSVADDESTQVEGTPA